MFVIFYFFSLLHSKTHNNIATCCYEIITAEMPHIDHQHLSRAFNALSKLSDCPSSFTIASLYVYSWSLSFFSSSFGSRESVNNFGHDKCFILIVASLFFFFFFFCASHDLLYLFVFFFFPPNTFTLTSH